MEDQSAATQPEPSAKTKWRNWIVIAFLVYALLVAVNVIGDGFFLATAEGAEELFELASNPLVALIIGVVATAAMQSSSTATSVIVGMVAGGLPLGIAIPMIMGANIGTSLTSTLVSLGHIRDDVEFKRAFSAATVHDNFNFMAVALLFPLEVMFSPLERMSHYLVGFLPHDVDAGFAEASILGTIVSPAVDVVTAFPTMLSDMWAGLMLIAIGVGMILTIVTLLSKLLRKVMVGKALELMRTVVGRGPLSGIGAGATVTVMVQSSTTTTTLIVPMAGSGVFTLKQIYPFTLGTNIGTTVTALLASMAISGPTAALAIQIAVIHLLFNVTAILLIFGLPFLREVPMQMSRFLARLAQRNKLYVFGYIGSVFFVVPLTALGVTHVVG